MQRTASGASLPMQAQTFDGMWCRGSEQHVISGGHLTWADGNSSLVRRTGPGTICLAGEEMDGSFSARLTADGRQLLWSNGSSWTRAFHGGMQSSRSMASLPSRIIAFDKRERVDLEGLLSYLAQLHREGVSTRQILYVVNDWTLGGVISLEHHGIIVQLEAGYGFLTLNFGSSGIMWRRCREQPEYPEGTKMVKSYGTRLSPDQLLQYCSETSPFSVFGNDCKVWSAGLIEELRVESSRDKRVIACL